MRTAGVKPNKRPVQLAAKYMYRVISNKLTIRPEVAAQFLPVISVVRFKNVVTRALLDLPLKDLSANQLVLQAEIAITAVERCQWTDTIMTGPHSEPLSDATGLIGPGRPYYSYQEIVYNKIKGVEVKLALPLENYWQKIRLPLNFMRENVIQSWTQAEPID